MKKLLLALLLLVSSTAFAEEPPVITEDRQLTVRLAGNVIVGITNQFCLDSTLAKTHPLMAYAVREADGKRLAGCYTHDEFNIMIKWADGDSDKIPADYFLNPEQPKYVPAIPEPTL